MKSKYRDSVTRIQGKTKYPCTKKYLKTEKILIFIVFNNTPMTVTYKQCHEKMYSLRIKLKKPLIKAKHVQRVPYIRITQFR